MQAVLQAADRRGTCSTMEPAATAAFARAAAAVFAPEGLLWRLSHGTLRALESHNEYFSLYLLPFSRLVARLWMPPPQDEPHGAARAALAALPAELRDAIRVSDGGPPAETGSGPRSASGRGLVRLGRADDPAFGSDDEVRPLTQLLMRLRRLASTPQLPSGCTWPKDWRPLEVLGHSRLQLGGIAIDAAGSVWPHDLSRAASSGAVDDCCRLLLELLLEGLQVAEDIGSLRPWAARSSAELQLRLREQLGVPEPVLARLCSLLCDEIRAADPAAADPAAADPAEAEAAVPELSEMALSRAIEAAAAAAGQGEAATKALCAHLRLKLTVDAQRCEGQLLHATRIVDALLPSEGSVQLWEAAGALEGAVSAALVHLSATAQSHVAVMASRQWKLAGASVTSAHAAVNAFAAAAASGPEQASELVAEAGEGEPAAPAPPSLDPAMAGAKARQRSRASTTDFTATALSPAVAGAKMRPRSKSTTDLFARPTLAEAKQKLADEQKLAAARRDPNWPSRLRLVGAGVAALMRRAYELALSCSAQANGGTADPRDLHPCTWQLPLLLHATRCLRYAELSSWQLRLAWHLTLRLSRQINSHIIEPPAALPSTQGEDLIAAGGRREAPQTTQGEQHIRRSEAAVAEGCPSATDVAAPSEEVSSGEAAAWGLTGLLGAPPPPNAPAGYAAERRRHNLRILAQHGTLDLLSARRLPVMALELTMTPLGTQELTRRRRHSNRLPSTQLTAPQRLLLDDAARPLGAGAKAVRLAQAAGATPAQASHTHTAPPPPSTSCNSTHGRDALGAERLGAADVAARLEHASQDTSRRGHFLVLAPHGCGKSTVLQQVAVHLARSSSLVPIPLRGAELARRLEGRMERLGHCATPEARQEARTSMPPLSPSPSSSPSPSPSPLPAPSAPSQLHLHPCTSPHPTQALTEMTARDEVETVLCASYPKNGERLTMLRAALASRRGVLLIDAVDEGGRARELLQAYLLNAVVMQPDLLFVASAEPAGLEEEQDLRHLLLAGDPKTIGGRKPVWSDLTRLQLLPLAEEQRRTLATVRLRDAGLLGGDQERGGEVGDASGDASGEGAELVAQCCAFVRAALPPSSFPTRSPTAGTFRDWLADQVDDGGGEAVMMDEVGAGGGEVHSAVGHPLLVSLAASVFQRCLLRARRGGVTPPERHAAAASPAGPATATAPAAASSDAAVPAAAPATAVAPATAPAATSLGLPRTPAELYQMAISAMLETSHALEAAAPDFLGGEGGEPCASVAQLRLLLRHMALGAQQEGRAHSGGRHLQPLLAASTEMAAAWRTLTRRLDRGALPLLSVLSRTHTGRVHEVAFRHISVQELLCAEAICAGDAEPGSGLLDALGLRPVEWGARWSSVLRLGLQLGPSFGRALALVQGINFKPSADTQTALCIAETLSLEASSLAHHAAPDEGAHEYQTVGLRALAAALRQAPHLRTVRMHAVPLPLRALLGEDGDEDDATARAALPVVEPQGDGGARGGGDAGGGGGDAGDAGDGTKGGEQGGGAGEAEGGQGRVGGEEREAGTDGKGGEEDEDRAEGPQTKDSTSAAAAPPLVCTPEAIELACAGLLGCDAGLLAELLRSNRRLTSLRLPRNAIGARGAAGLASLLGDARCPPGLRLLDLCSNQLGCDGAVAIAHALRRNTSLLELKLSANGVPSPRAPLRLCTHSTRFCTPPACFCTPPHPPPPPHHLRTTSAPPPHHLCPCIAAGIGERGGLALGYAMSASATLQACTVAACTLPVQALRGASSSAAEVSEAVELGQRRLTEVDALLIGAMLGANTTLRRLVLHGNALCGVRDGWGGFACCGLRAVAAGLGANTALLALDLSQNALCAVEAYASGVQGNTASAAGTEPLRLECVQALHGTL